MRTVLLTLLSMLVLPIAAFGQWDFEAAWPPNEDLQFSSAHGIAVDPDGKVWVQYFSATDSVQVPELDDSWQPVRVLYVFNPDGTEADISPIKFVDLPGGERDTLGGRLGVDENGDPVWLGHPGTGLRADHNGNILVAVDGSPGTELASALLYRLNYETGEGMNKVTFDARAPTAPAVDSAGNVYITDVFPGDPLRVYDEAFNFIDNAIAETIGFSRSFEVSPDGNTVYWAGYTNNAVIAYTRPDEFSAYDSVGVVIPGVDSESMSWNPATGYLWVAAGSTNDPPNDFEGVDTNWDIQTWYAFDPAELAVDTVPTPEDSLSWTPATEADTTGRPRGLAFGPSGDVAYIIQFEQPAPSVQKLVRGVANAIEPIDSELPSAIALKQNYPNPFNPSTTINFAVKEAGHVTLKVFDALGRQVGVLVDERAVPGTYEVRFDGSGLASGTYLYVLESNGQHLSKTMQLVK